MGEREGEAGSSSLAGGGETPLESIVVHINGDNTAVPVSGNEKKWLEYIVNGESFKNPHDVIWTKIERVPAMLRVVKENRGCYDPLVVSIGPYHFGNPRLELMQQHKLTMARQKGVQDVKGIAGTFDCQPTHFLDLICTNLFDKTVLTQPPPRDCSDCTNGPDDFGVSSDICLMDSLIDHAEDVMELRKKGILLNFLGSDQQVADLFNEIADNLVSHQHAYAVVKDKIEKQYKNRLKIWLAEWLHTHFTSPWTVLAFIGAILALELSVTQTYESMKESNS
ncbi:hypothetical protein Patl1_22872 [Pistacia atlantica]|uniref:Uncharacterized protein n=1 Tax=Pistacia atlantica TaxID=434234 RepID=A0ACC0ZWL6_9ROSI|nr:hypothetical protein Patl1_22872 [Pistacia atlantica]